VSAKVAKSGPAFKSGLAPIGCESARILILGSLPGDESLRQQQYYAHPQNQFWRALAAVFDQPPCATYDACLALIARHDLVVWDVVKRAAREGSLDTAIKHPTPNAFGPLLRQHPKMDAIGFNGQKAAALFKRHVAPTLGDRLSGIRTAVLPSTSPAAAMLSFDQKVEQWRAFLVPTR
jgi:double-stranded uracil-DNA glycosylase